MTGPTSYSARIVGYLSRAANIKVILVAFVLLGVAYGLGVPILEKPDEPAHLAYIKMLIDGAGFPLSLSDAPQQESSQPPLYYVSAALAMKLLGPSTADWPTALTHNPAYPNLARDSRNDNKNVFIHSVVDTFPFEGTARAVLVARLVSLFFGAVTVYATYRLALELFPERRAQALLAASFVAFLPQFIFISSSTSNDSTAAALCTLALWATARVMRRGFTWQRAIALGLALGGATLSKVSAIGLWPLALIAVVAFSTEKQPQFKQRLAWSGVVVGVALFIAGPWLARTALLFGDVLGTSTHLSMPWARAEPLPLTTALGQIPGALNSWWLSFGWGDIIAPAWVYGVLNALGLIGLAGVAVGWWQVRDQRLGRWGVILLAAWMLVIVVAFVRWIQLLDAALGRLLFPALSATAVLCALGWHTLLRRWAYWPAVGLFALSLVALPLWLSPAYARPTLFSQAHLVQQPGQAIDIRYGDVARLVRVAWSRDPWPQPGDAPTLRLCWEPLKQDARPLMVLTQIIGAQDRVIVTRRTLPGLGSYPTSAWQPNAFFCDDVRLPLPDTTPAPAVYQVEVGLINEHTGERLPAFAPDGSELGTNFVGQIKIAPTAYVTPPIDQPLAQRLGDQFELVGYDLDRTVVKPGESVGLRTYWRALRRPDADYTIFAQVRDTTNRVVGQKDGPPQMGAYPTSFWDAGEVVIDDRVIEIPSNTSPGKYPIMIGLYLPDGTRLKVDGGPANEVTLPQELEVQP
jgi:hypothetical protein